MAARRWRWCRSAWRTRFATCASGAGRRRSTALVPPRARRRPSGARATARGSATSRRWTRACQERSRHEQAHHLPPGRLHPALARGGADPDGARARGRLAFDRHAPPAHALRVARRRAGRDDPARPGRLAAALAVLLPALPERARAARPGVQARGAAPRARNVASDTPVTLATVLRYPAQQKVGPREDRSLLEPVLPGAQPPPGPRAAAPEVPGLRGADDAGAPAAGEAPGLQAAAPAPRLVGRLMAPKRTVDPKFVRPGRGRDAKPVILYAGLLDTAHDAGLESITTELLHLDLQNRTAGGR